MKPMQGIRLWINPIRIFMREADVIHRATSRWNRVLCSTSSWSGRVPRGMLSCRTVSIGYFGSRCNASGYKAERDGQARFVKKKAGPVHTRS
jgi:hypothetical protein